MKKLYEVFINFLAVVVLIAVASYYTEASCKGQRITLLGYSYMCIETKETK